MRSAWKGSISSFMTHRPTDLRHISSLAGSPTDEGICFLSVIIMSVLERFHHFPLLQAEEKPSLAWQFVEAWTADAEQVDCWNGIISKAGDLLDPSMLKVTLFWPQGCNLGDHQMPPRLKDSSTIQCDLARLLSTSQSTVESWQFSFRMLSFVDASGRKSLRLLWKSELPD